MRDTVSGLLEVDAFDHGQALQVAAQAAGPDSPRAKPHPVSPAENARAAEHDLARGGDADPDGAAEIDAIGAVIEVDQHRQRMRGTGLAARGHRGLLDDL